MPYLAIDGGNDRDIVGTYYHPDLVLPILMWANKKLSDLMYDIIWKSINNENVHNRQFDEIEYEY